MTPDCFPGGKKKKNNFDVIEALPALFKVFLIVFTYTLD